MECIFSVEMLNPYLRVCDSIVTEVNKEFIELIGFSMEELLGKSLLNIGDMVKFNWQILLDNISHNYCGFIFTKALEVREVNISITENLEKNERTFTFVEIPNSRFDNKFPYIEQLYKNNTVGVAIYEPSKLVLLKANQAFMNFFDESACSLEYSIGKSIHEFCKDWTGSEANMLLQKVADTGQFFIDKEILFKGFQRGFTYWNITLIPILENGMVKYIVETSTEVTEVVLNKMRILEQNEIILKQKEQLNAILENIYEGVIVVDTQGNLLTMNSSALHMHGLDSLKDYNHFNDFSSNFEFFNLDGTLIPLEESSMGRVLRGELFTNFEMWVCRKDINHRWIGSYSGTPIYDKNRKMVMAVITSRDISKQKQMEVFLKKNEHRLRIATEGASIGVYTYYFDTGKEYFSQEFKDLWGIKDYNAPPLDEDNLYIGLHPDDKQIFLTAMTAANDPQSDGVLILDYRIIQPDGTIKWLHVHGQTEFIGEGKNRRPWRSAGAAIDISDRKKVEIEIKCQKELLETIIGNVQDALVVYDKKGSILLMNSEAYKQYPNLNTQTTVKNFHNGYKFFDLDNNVIPVKNLPTRRVFKGEIIRNERIIIKHPEWTRYTEINATPIFDDENNLVSVVLSHHDISESLKNQEKIKIQQEQLIKAKREKIEALEKVLEMKDEFFINISHELKTPLNVIYSTVQLFNRYYSNGSLDERNDSIIKYMESIKKNSYRLSKLINNIVDLSKIEAGFMELSLSNNNIVEIVEEIVTSVTAYTDIKGLNITFDTDVEEYIIACDPEMIERIILNLISNAIKFSNKGEEILVDIKNRNDFIEISVKDNGIGIEENYLGMIFDRYKQVDKSLSRNAEGTGIGLSLVKSIVELHGGRISVESEYGKGSKFTVTLPTREIMQENMILSNKIRNTNEGVQLEFSDIYA